MKQYLYGRNPIKERINAKKVIHTLYLQKGSDTQSFEQFAITQRIPVQWVDKGQLTNMVGEANQTTFKEMLQGLEHMAQYIDESFEERVDELDPPND